ncbi:hypothetical protein Tco_0227810 [Tanacetum coccineum]
MIFGNMKREGKGFFGRVTPLFQTMMVQAQEEVEPIADEGPNEENVPTHSNDLLLSGEDSIKLNELMELCTKLQQRVLDLEHTKTTQALEIDSLKRRVKKLENKKRSRTHGLKRLYKVGLSAKVVSSDDEGLGNQEDASKQGRKIDDIDVDAEITLVDETQGRINDEEMFDTSDLDGDEVFVETKEHVVNAATTTSTTVSAATITEVDITLAQALAELKSAKPKAVTTAATITITAITRPKAKGLVIQEQEQASIPTPIVSFSQSSHAKDNGKGIMVEDPLQMKKKDQISYDQQEAMRLQAEFDEEARIAREKEEANVSLIEEWNDIQAKNEADQLLAERLQAREQEALTIEERAKLFQQLLEKRRKFFADKRVKEKRNRPSTKDQQRSIMCTYLKNMAGWKAKDLKNKTELVEESSKKAYVIEESSMKAKADTTQESSSKKAREELVQESSKKQKVDENNESEELKKNLEIVPNDGDDVTIEATPLSIKILIMYLTFTKMLKNFDKEDLEVLWKIVKARFKMTKLVNYMDEFLLLNLKTMFKHHVEDSVWKEQQGLVKVLSWKLFDSCGVHCVTVQSISYYLLVEKKYPLTNHTLC